MKYAYLCLNVNRFRFKLGIVQKHTAIAVWTATSRNECATRKLSTFISLLRKRRTLSIFFHPLRMRIRATLVAVIFIIYSRTMVWDEFSARSVLSVCIRKAFFTMTSMVDAVWIRPIRNQWCRRKSIFMVVCSPHYFDWKSWERINVAIK